MALRNQVGEKQLALETQVGLAQLSIEEGRAAEVEKPLRQWKQQFHQERQADDELAASTALTRALLAQGKPGGSAGRNRIIAGSRGKEPELAGPP